MKKIILDGYNVIYKIPALTRKLDESLEAGRIALAHFLSGWRKRYSNADICIVFDGKDHEILDASPLKIAGIECIFTRTGETADNRIIKIVHDSENPRDILVISEDNSVGNSCCAHGAEVKPSSFLMPRNKKKERVSEDKDKAISATNSTRITNSYKNYLEDTGKI
ncbi:MAG: NYN domain-containing protein [Candidatus Omnitrophica bacterium]|nr:NYN domain-containing protein [Candidatus Omnitrophota bacterium]